MNGSWGSTGRRNELGHLIKVFTLQGIWLDEKGSQMAGAHTHIHTSPRFQGDPQNPGRGWVDSGQSALRSTNDFPRGFNGHLV